MEAKEVSNSSSSSEQQETISSQVENNEAPSLKQEKEMKDRQKVKNYQLLQYLGEGAYGEVILVRYIPDETTYAMKVFKQTRNMEVMFNKEVNALRRVQGVNHCVQLFSVLDTFQEDKRALTMELCRGGELLSYILESKGLEEQDVRQYLRDIVSVLENLQSRRLAHLDIKADNIFLNQEFNLVLGDFGMCEEIPIGEVRISQYQKGSKSYQLPELKDRVPYNPFQADIFSAGVTVFTMYSCLLPFQQFQLYSMLFQNPDIFWSEMRNHSPNPDFSDNLNQDFVDLFTRMVHQDRNQRITLDQIKEHPFYIGIPDSPPSLSKTLSQINSELNHFTALEPSESQTKKELTRGHCSESILEKFEHYEDSVSNLLTKRQAEIYNKETGRLCDFWTNIDILTLFMYLFIRQEDFTSEIPKLSDSQYKLDCIQKPKEEEGANDTEKSLEQGDIKFSISLQADQDNQKTYVLFTKTSGDSFEYFKLVAFIKKIVKEFK